MPDLILHGAGAYLVARGLRIFLPAAVLGGILPDLLRGPGFVDPVFWNFFGPLHEPLPVFLACLLLSRAFVPPLRGRALGGLSLGAALHILLDACQDHLGYGTYPLFPVLRTPLDMGLFSPEGYFWLGPLLFLACLSLEVRRGS